MPGGRPTDYYDGLGEEILELMKEGYSLTAAAASCGFHRQRIYEYEERFPEFADTIKLARGLRVLKLETDLLAAKDGPYVTSRIFALKNADPKEWRDKHDHTLSDPDGNALSFEVIYTAVKPDAG